MENHQFPLIIPSLKTYNKGCRCTICKKANAERQALHRQTQTPEQKAKTKEYMAQYYANNLEDHKQQMLAYRAKHLDELRAYDRERNNTPKRKKQKQESTKRCREQHKKGNARWYEANKERLKAKSAEWRRNNPEHHAILTQRYRARKFAAQGSHTAEEWRAILEHFNYQCAKCQSTSDLTKDHIIPLSKGGSNEVENLQPLCRSCNAKKSNKIL